MIIQIFIQMFATVMIGIADRFPNSVPGETDSYIFNAIQYFFTALHKGDSFLPTGTYFKILLIIIATEILLATFDLAIFIYKRIRG